MERRGDFARIYSIRAPRSPVFDRRYRLLLPHHYVGASRSAIRQILDREQPDVIETCDKYTLPGINGLIKRRSGTGPRPTLIGLSCERMDDNIGVWLGGGRVAHAATRAYLRRVYLPLFDGHIANSAYTAAELEGVIAAHAGSDWRLRHLRGQIRVGPMGVDLGGFSPQRRSESVRQQVLRALGGDGQSTLLVYAGRISPEKHVMVLPEMMRDLVGRGIDARLVICGDGPLRPLMERTAAEVVPGRVIILGHVTRVHLARVLASADVFVHPNPREPFGIGPLEAMASGLPTVLPRSGGVLTYATDHNACLTSPGAAGLADGIFRLLRQPVRTHQLRLAAMADVQRLAWPEAVATYFDHYDSMDEARRAFPSSSDVK